MKVSTEVKALTDLRSDDEPDKVLVESGTQGTITEEMDDGSYVVAFNNGVNTYCEPFEIEPS